MTADHKQPKLGTAQLRPKPSTAWAIIGTRLLLVGALSLVTWYILQSTTQVNAYPPSTVWATLTLLPINLVGLWWLNKLYRSQGVTLRQAMGIRRGRLLQDIGWGLLWLIVLNIPFMLAVTATVFALYGRDAEEAFATIFFNPDALLPMSSAVLLGISVFSVIPFMVLNAPVEELIFRGYGLAGLQRPLGRAGGIIMSSVLFGAQHVVFAATVPGMVVFFIAFTIWGLIAAVIVSRQQRLFPVIIAHWIINIGLSSPALILPILMVTGVIEQP